MKTRDFKNQSCHESSKNQKEKPTAQKRDSSVDSGHASLACQQAVSLPPQFAERLLSLELEMENPQVNMDDLNSLLQLYASAVEYYESMQSNKYFIFKNKTQELLLKPNVQLALQRGMENSTESTSNLKNKKVDEIDNKPNQNDNLKQSNIQISQNKLGAQIPLQQQEKEHKLKVQYINSQDSKASVKELLSQHKHEINAVKNVVQTVINEQTSQVFNRLEQRRKSKMEKSLYLDRSIDELKERSPRSSSNNQNSNQQNTELSEFFKSIGQKKQPANSQTKLNTTHQNHSLQKSFSTTSLIEKTEQIQNVTTQIEEVPFQKQIQIEKTELNQNVITKIEAVPFHKQIKIENLENMQLTSNKLHSEQKPNAINNLNKDSIPNHFITDSYSKVANSKQQKKYQNINSFQKVLTINSKPSFILKNESSLKIEPKENPFNFFEIPEKEKQGDIANAINKRQESPVHVRMKSYSKGGPKPINVQWMTAQTNQFNNPFGFN